MSAHQDDQQVQEQAMAALSALAENAGMASNRAHFVY
jgi:hypothetical protein